VTRSVGEFRGSRSDSTARHPATLPARPPPHRPRRPGRFHVLASPRRRGHRGPTRAATPAGALVRTRGRDGGADVVDDVGSDSEAGRDLVATVNAQSPSDSQAACIRGQTQDLREGCPVFGFGLLNARDDAIGGRASRTASGARSGLPGFFRIERVKTIRNGGALEEERLPDFIRTRIL
jgi:hypothetical protein